jgi:hypothetical protein
MSRYFFNVFDGRDLIDDVGQELSTFAEVKCVAVKYAGQLICDAAGSFWDQSDLEMHVTDEAGLVLFTLVFAGYETAATMVDRKAS